MIFGLMDVCISFFFLKQCKYYLSRCLNNPPPPRLEIESFTLFLQRAHSASSSRALEPAMQQVTTTWAEPYSSIGPMMANRKQQPWELADALWTREQPFMDLCQPAGEHMDRSWGCWKISSLVERQGYKHRETITEQLTEIIILVENIKPRVFI